MREAWRLHPVLGFAELLLCSAGRAIEKFAAVSVSVTFGPGVVTDRAFEIEPAPLPGSISVIRHGGIQGTRDPLLAINPDSLAGGILRERDGEALTWRISVLGTESS